MVEVPRCCRASTDCSPQGDKERQIDTRSDTRQDEITGDLPQNVSDKENRDGNVELVPRHSQVSLQTLYSSGTGCQHIEWRLLTQEHSGRDN
jgi:hypothetical protein